MDKSVIDLDSFRALPHYVRKTRMRQKQFASSLYETAEILLFDGVQIEYYQNRTSNNATPRKIAKNHLNSLEQKALG